MKFAKKRVQKSLPHLRCVAYEMQTFENDINCTELKLKSYHVKISHRFNQLLTEFAQHILLQPANSSNMRVQLVN